MAVGWLVGGIAAYSLLLFTARRPAGTRAGTLRGLIASVIALASVAALNYVVNPFGTFAPRLFEPVTLHSRADKIRLLAASQPPEVVILGSSPTFEMAPAQIERATGLRAFNASVHGGSPRDYHALVNYLRQHGGPPKFILVALSFEALRPTASVGFEPGDPLSAYLPGAPARRLAMGGAPLLALDQTSAAVRRLSASIAGSARPPAYRFDADGQGHFSNPPNLTLTERRGGNPELTFPDLDPTQWEHLAALLEQCRASGTRVIAFVPPLQPQLARLWEETTSLDPITARLAQRLHGYMPAPIAAFHDFRRLESFGGRPDLFLDMRHPDAESNRLMLDIMLRDIAAAS